MHSTLILEFSGEIAKITLNRPEKRNAINTQMIADLQTALDTIEKSHSRVVIVTGAGTSFCAGMDLEMLAAIAKQSPAENQEDSRRIAKMLRRLWSFPRPMIAAVNGPAYAGGCGIATLCDFTLAAPEAKFGYTEVKIGFLPAIVSGKTQAGVAQQAGIIALMPTIEHHDATLRVRYAETDQMGVVYHANYLIWFEV